MVTLVPDSNGEDSAPTYGLRLREHNKCHNPEGAGGGQFCATVTSGTRVDAATSGLSAKSIAMYTQYYGEEGKGWWAVQQEEGQPPGIQIVSHSFGGHKMLLGGPQQKESWAIRDYIDKGYHTINQSLRHGPGVETMGQLSDLRQTIGHLDRIIARNILLEPVAVYRALHTDTLEGLLVGDRVQDKGYLSTTWSREVAQDIVNKGMLQPGLQGPKDPRPRHTIQIDLPKGQAALEPEQWEGKDYGEIAEREFLLPRGMILEVTQVDAQGRVTHMKVVPQ
jgi:hypothetical protein